MKGGKKKNSGEPPVDGNNDVIREQPYDESLQEKDRAEEDEEIWEEQIVEGDGDTEKPKLPEGFYEIETVRRKRVRKGKVQYLIKWRGWPESANTWEPKDNLVACYDFVDAFEESLRSGKQQSTRKHKRKHGLTPASVNRKKQQEQEKFSPVFDTYNEPAVKVRIIEEPMPSAPLDSNGNSSNNVEVDIQVNDNDSKLDSPVSESKEKDEMDLKLSEVVGATLTKETSGDGHTTNGFPTANGVEPLQSSRCTGAKRRKPASVKRFKQDTTQSGVADNLDDSVPATSAPFVTFMAESRSKSGDDSKDEYAITEIIKVMSYSESVSNDFRDIVLTFLVKRSDGSEVLVDNKSLKKNNPLLLCNFYEQRLHYHATD